MKNVVFVLAILSVCGFGGVKFYLPKLIDAKIQDQIIGATAAIQKQNDQLAEVVKNLEIRQKKLEEQEPASVGHSNFEIDFNRWNCWCDLKDKLLCGGECSEELTKFRLTFFDCPDLLNQVDSIAVDQNNAIKENTLINNLRKFFKIHSVNERKLERISGCVILLSIRKAGVNGRE